jgi:hypothetical protein
MAEVVVRWRELTVWAETSTRAIVVDVADFALGVADRAGVGLSSLMTVVVVGLINTRQAGNPLGRFFLTKKRGPQSFAKEPLTFFPDPECCPPSSAAVVVVVPRLTVRLGR